MQHFFRVYKELEGKTTAVSEARGQREAVEIIRKALRRYEETFGQTTEGDDDDIAPQIRRI
jgi:inorganic pyrophosphatase